MHVRHEPNRPQGTCHERSRFRRGPGKRGRPPVRAPGAHRRARQDLLQHRPALHRPRRGRPRPRPRRLLLPARPERLRQDDGPQHPRGVRGADGRDRRVRGRAGRGAVARPGGRLPGRQLPLRVADGPAERRVRPAARRGERGGADPGERRVPEPRRPRRPGAQVPARALGRDAPAGAARAGAREPPADARHGRALRRAGRPEPPRAPGRASPHLAGAQGDGALHHPRHRGGAAPRDADRGDDGRPERGDQGDHRHPAGDEAGPGGPRVRRDVRPGPGPHRGRDQQVPRRPGGAGEGGVEAARADLHRGARAPPAGGGRARARRASASTRCRSSRSSSSGTSGRC